MQETRVQSLGQEDPLEKENGNPLQYSCLENPMEGGAWWATVQGVIKSWSRLSTYVYTHTHKDVYILIHGTCNYVTLQGKQKGLCRCD